MIAVIQNVVIKSLFVVLANLILKQNIVNFIIIVSIIDNVNMPIVMEFAILIMILMKKVWKRNVANVKDGIGYVWLIIRKVNLNDLELNQILSINGYIV
jgi:hypothetical protein